MHTAPSASTIRLPATATVHLGSPHSVPTRTSAVSYCVMLQGFKQRSHCAVHAAGAVKDFIRHWTGVADVSLDVSTGARYLTALGAPVKGLLEALHESVDHRSAGLSSPLGHDSSGAGPLARESVHAEAPAGRRSLVPHLSADTASPLSPDVPGGRCLIPRW